jgi:hypothetical protein
VDAITKRTSPVELNTLISVVDDANDTYQIFEALEKMLKQQSSAVRKSQIYFIFGR